MKTTLAIVATVLFTVLVGCGEEADGVQVNEAPDTDAGTPTKHDMQFPEPDAGQTEKDAGGHSSCPIVLYYRDRDGDGYGRLSMATFADCSDQYFPGWVTEAGDCNDRNPRVYPGALEICNDRDDDCDMIVDDNCATDCAYKADGTLAKNQGVDGCTQTTDFGVCSGNWICLNGQLACSAPEATQELCDGVDNNCDGQVDEDYTFPCRCLYEHIAYQDTDGDGWGNPFEYLFLCQDEETPEGYIAVSMNCQTDCLKPDCDDNDPTVTACSTP